MCIEPLPGRQHAQHPQGGGAVARPRPAGLGFSAGNACWALRLGEGVLQERAEAVPACRPDAGTPCCLPGMYGRQGAPPGAPPPLKPGQAGQARQSDARFRPAAAIGGLPTGKARPARPGSLRVVEGGWVMARCGGEHTGGPCQAWALRGPAGPEGHAKGPPGSDTVPQRASREQGGAGVAAAREAGAGWPMTPAPR